LLVQSLNVSVRSPSGNSEGNRLGAASSNAPVFNAPDYSPLVTGAGTPTVTATVPQFLGQSYIDTSARKTWSATQISSPPVVADWSILN